MNRLTIAVVAAPWLLLALFLLLSCTLRGGVVDDVEGTLLIASQQQGECRAAQKKRDAKGH